MSISIAIIGAGMAGTTLAQRLQAGSVQTHNHTVHKYAVTLFEKSRGTGGRMASCRLSDSRGTPYSADLGAPAFAAQHPRFIRWLQQQQDTQQQDTHQYQQQHTQQQDTHKQEQQQDTHQYHQQQHQHQHQHQQRDTHQYQQQQQNILQSWQPRHHSFSGVTLPAPTLWTGVPRQSAITRALSSTCELRSDTRVGQLQINTAGSQWQLRDIYGALLGNYDQVVVTTPAPQAAQLLAVRPSLGALPGTLRPAPAWVSVVVLPGRAGLEADWYSGAHPLLERAVCDSAKPGREATDTASVWQLQARRDWSAAHLDRDADWVGQQLLQALTELAQCAALRPLAQRTHRWLYGQHPQTVPQPFLWEPAGPAGPALGACGDWLLQSDIEGAWLSAQALADQLLAG